MELQQCCTLGKEKMQAARSAQTVVAVACLCVAQLADSHVVAVCCWRLFAGVQAPLNGWKMMCNFVPGALSGFYWR